MLRLRTIVMFACVTLVAAACALVTQDARSGAQTVVLDPMTTVQRLQLSPQNLSGRHAIGVTVQDPPEGADRSVELVADFAAPDTEWVSVDWTGPRVVGRCRRLAMRVWSAGDAPTLRWTVEDAAGRWHYRDLTLEARSGWQEAVVGMERPAEWTPMLRRGEAALPMEHPIRLRRLGLKRLRASDRPTVRVRFSGLRAETDISPGDLLDARIQPAKPSGVFFGGQVPEMIWRASNPSGRALTLRCRASVTGMTGPTKTLDLGVHTIRAKGSVTVPLRFPVALYGPYDVTFVAEHGAWKRAWRSRFAYLRTSPVPGRQSWRTSKFGVCGNVGGVPQEFRRIAARLNQLAGSGWSRIGLSWQQVNPAPNVWAWDRPGTVEGPIGSALRTAGRSYVAPHDPSLDCADEVTVAFWARIADANGSTQVAVRKWGPGDRRNYGAYFHRETGALCFSAGYERMPGTVADFSSGVSAFDGQWHHYAATYSRYIRSVCLYVDGTLMTSAAHDGGRLRITDADLILGQDLAGDLDEVMVYRRALGPADVAALARRADPPKDGLVAWYSFDAPGGTYAPSASLSSALKPLAPMEPDAIRSAREASEQGMATLGILGFPPAWASTAGTASRHWLHPPENRAWTRYVEGVTREYARTLNHWEIWNEPNSPTFWDPEPDPQQYLEVLKAAYGAAKRGNPQSTVLMPGLRGPSGPSDTTGRAYLERLLALGAGKWCDAISVHPYRSGSPEETGLAEDLRWIARRCSVAGVKRPIWLTEVGWSTDIPDGATPRAQAAMLARAYLLAFSTGLVERLFWFRMHDSGPDRTFPEDNYGLCDDRMTPKPAFFAHRTLAVLLSDARPDGELAVLPAKGGADLAADAGIRWLRFRSPSERFSAVWSTKGPDWITVAVGKSRVAVTDLMGNGTYLSAHDGVVLVEVDDLPKFVRGLPERVTVTSGLVQAGPTATGAATGLRIRNPYPKPVTAKLKVQARGGSVASVPSTVSIARLGSATVPIRWAPALPPGGDARLTVRVTYPGGTVVRSFERSSKGDFVPLSGAASAAGE